MVFSHEKPEANFSSPEVSHKIALQVAFGSQWRSILFFRWLHGSVIPRNPADPEFLQLAPCADADDFGVRAAAFRSLMRALPPAIDTGQYSWPNLGLRKCFEVQVGSVRCQELLDWVSQNW